VYDRLSPSLASGTPTDYDIICPTFWLAARLISKGWAEPLPLDLIPNHVNLDPAFLRQPFDRGALYNMPWQSGITGIAYNTKLTKPVRTIGDLMNRADLKGQVGFFSEMRDSIGLALLSMGKDPSRVTERDAKAALDLLTDRQKSGHIAKFANNEQYLDGLKSGEFAACVAWSGDIVQLKQERPDIEFVIPEEGGMQWFDTMIIPKRAKFGAAAARWMDFVYDPANAARITASVKFITPVLGVREELTKLGRDAAKLADDPLLFPNAETRRRLSTWNGTTVAEEDALAVVFNTLVNA
jgi:spermidine/putrescine transport system substrate-binding protein